MGKIYFQDKQECKTHGRTDKQITFKRERSKQRHDGTFFTVNLFQFSIRYLAAMGKERKEPGRRKKELTLKYLHIRKRRNDDEGG